MKYQAPSGLATSSSRWRSEIGASIATAPHTQQKTTTLRYVRPMATTTRKRR